jgi:sugar phosphate isomerase/epimerase
MLTLEPEVFHLSDGDMDTPYDHHRHLGKGSYPLEEILSMIPENSLLSLETPRDSRDCLDDFKEDVNYLRACLSRRDQKKSAGNRCAL